MKLQISGSPMTRELPGITFLWISEWYTQYQGLHKSCMRAPKFCVVAQRLWALIVEFFHVTLQAPRILGWFLDYFEKMCTLHGMHCTVHSNFMDKPNH